MKMSASLLLESGDEAELVLDTGLVKAVYCRQVPNLNKYVFRLKTGGFEIVPREQILVDMGKFQSLYQGRNPEQIKKMYENGGLSGASFLLCLIVTLVWVGLACLFP